MLYLLIFAVSLFLALFLTPVARKWAVKLGAVDMPHDRKVHENPTPTLGGLAILLAVVFSTLAGKVLVRVFPSLARPVGMSDALSSYQLLGIIIASSLIAVLGAVDDMRRLSPWMKLAGQVAASLVLISFGVEISTVALPRGNVIDLTASPLLSILLTLLWMVAFTNIINLIDGLDGLAAGVCTISAAAFFVYGTRIGGDPNTLQATVISAAVAGACLGFLRHNFHPASIFMGDSGAMFLGFILGAVSIQGILKRTAVATLFTPLIILAVPIVDTGLAILRRARKGKPFHYADKEHIHHRLLYIGHSQRQAVLIIYLWTALLTGIALSLEFVASRTIIFTLLAVGVASLLATTLPRIVLGGRELEKEEENFVGTDWKGEGRDEG
ncbi:MraY family glycosyltransferase [Candidatus Solincola tengchongensis]|uniref:glycosyltransferase family 4 protein n=1 Tax=Candidatus Solincola tengchongensis TaxID=2900693 RepID=UPI00257AB262|nr:MraY family glycosyltransferase [Candidatus Solincola tengchongensis]